MLSQSDLKVVESSLLDDLHDEGDGALDERPHRVLVVHVVRVPVGKIQVLIRLAG